MIGYGYVDHSRYVIALLSNQDSASSSPFSIQLFETHRAGSRDMPEHAEANPIRFPWVSCGNTMTERWWESLKHS